MQALAVTACPNQMVGHHISECNLQLVFGIAELSVGLLNNVPHISNQISQLATCRVWLDKDHSWQALLGYVAEVSHVGTCLAISSIQVSTNMSSSFMQVETLVMNPYRRKWNGIAQDALYYQRQQEICIHHQEYLQAEQSSMLPISNS